MATRFLQGLRGMSTQGGQNNALSKCACVVATLCCVVLIYRVSNPASATRQLSSPKELNIATWNIAAINNNPFEYWITYDDNPVYQQLMVSSHACCSCTEPLPPPCCGTIHHTPLRHNLPHPPLQCLTFTASLSVDTRHRSSVVATLYLHTACACTRLHTVCACTRCIYTLLVRAHLAHPRFSELFIHSLLQPVASFERHFLTLSDTSPAAAASSVAVRSLLRSDGLIRWIWRELCNLPAASKTSR